MILVLAHDMQPDMAAPDYLMAITSNPELETIYLHESLWAGVGVTLKKTTQQWSCGAGSV